MNDATYSFISDVRERKTIARGAKSRVCGSKSKKCSLPSDGMTHAQWKRRNGPVTTYSIGKPMTYEQFKSMPADRQKMYLMHLLENYNASNTDIANMFGITSTSVANRRKKLGIIPTLGRGNKPSQEDRRLWQSFLAKGDNPGACTPETCPDEPDCYGVEETPVVDTVEEITPPELAPTPVVTQPTEIKPTYFTASFRCTPKQFVKWMHENIRGSSSDDTYEFTITRKEA